MERQGHGQSENSRLFTFSTNDPMHTNTAEGDSESEGGDSDSPDKPVLKPKPGKKTRGRVKIKYEYIKNKDKRFTTFSKRKTGLMKKVLYLILIFLLNSKQNINLHSIPIEWFITSFSSCLQGLDGLTHNSCSTCLYQRAPPSAYHTSPYRTSPSAPMSS